ncbi:MAG: alpha/beta hydrolase-fold protein [Myxococcota bacterium]
MKNSIRSPRFTRLLGASAALALFGFASSAGAQSQLAGRVISPVTIPGADGSSISFTVYLPAEHDTNSSARFPVVYHLHGINGAHNGPGQIGSVPASHENAVQLGLVEPVIIVFPDGYGNSFWADTFSGQAPAESDIMEAIIPHVDANFRTIADRGHRIVQGFSMGGFGAAKFAAKFPDVFGAAVLYDGALFTWTELVRRHADLALLHFNNDENYFNEFSPYFWVSQNAAILQSSVPYRQVVGNLTQPNLTFRDHLVANGISPSFIDTPADHDLLTILNSADPPGSSTTVGQVSWDFIQGIFDSNPQTSALEFAGIAADDGWVEELSETSNTGGALDAAAATLLVGDTAVRRQLRSILSFDTSALPDNATIVSATLRLTRVGGSGAVSSLGGLRADVQRGAFSGNRILQATDFQAPATAASGIPLVSVPAVGQSTTAALNAAGLLAINLGPGRTQVRLNFAVDDDNDGVADNVAFASASHSSQSARPVLSVTFR